MKLLNKIKVACIYESSNIFLSGTHFDNTYYHFFMNALKRNSKLETTYFPTKDVFDASILKDKFDIILLWQNNEFGMPKEIIGIQDLDIPVLADVCDPQDAHDAIKFHKKWKIDHFSDKFSSFATEPPRWTWEVRLAWLVATVSYGRAGPELNPFFRIASMLVYVKSVPPIIRNCVLSLNSTSTGIGAESYCLKFMETA